MCTDVCCFDVTYADAKCSSKDIGHSRGLLEKFWKALIGCRIKRLWPHGIRCLKSGLEHFHYCARTGKSSSFSKPDRQKLREIINKKKHRIKTGLTNVSIEPPGSVSMDKPSK